MLAPTGGASDFSTQSRLVLVPVTVADRTGAAILDLRQDDFQVFDNSERRPIVSVAREEAPVMVGVVFDLSGSMKPKIPQAAAAIRAITETAGLADQGFLVTFADRPEVRVDVTSDLNAMADSLRFASARGGTALVDAVYEAMQKARSTRHKRRTIVIISDGGDNASRHTESELVALAREADTQIYAISIQDHFASREERRGSYILHDLSEMTGGLHFVVRNRGALPEIAGRIALAMRNTYLIGFTQPPNADSGKWRTIHVVLGGAGKAWRVHARTGYYAAE